YTEPRERWPGDKRGPLSTSPAARCEGSSRAATSTTPRMRWLGSSTIPTTATAPRPSFWSWCCWVPYRSENDSGQRTLPIVHRGDSALDPGPLDLLVDESHFLALLQRHRVG